MLDLFYQGSFIENARKLKRELKKYAKSIDIELEKQFKLLHGEIDSVGNNILFITEPSRKTQQFNAWGDKQLKKLLDEYEMPNYFMTRCHLLPVKWTRDEVKYFSPWIKKITDIIQPKLIVVLGELSCFSFFRRKFIIGDHHGTQIGDYNGIPILYTQGMLYYKERAQYEDDSYKQFNKETDWKFIKEQYDRYIT